jgi:hypothetical protein
LSKQYKEGDAMKKQEVKDLRNPPSRENGRIVIREGDTWVEKADPIKLWIIADILPEENSTWKRIFLRLEDGTPCDRSYAERYFRRHWEHVYESLRKRNKKSLEIATLADVPVVVSR